MSEFPSNHTEQKTAYPIDRELVVGRLQEYSIGIEAEDLEGLADEEVMTVILIYVTMHDLDMDDILREITPVERRRREEDGDVDEI